MTINLKKIEFYYQRKIPAVDLRYSFASKFFRELFNTYRIGGRRVFLLYFIALMRKLNRIFLEKSLRSADDLMQGKSINLTYNGTQFTVDGKHFGLVREIYLSKCYFPPIPGFEIKKTDTVIDLGCNVGVFTILSAKIAKMVIAVDAQRTFLDELKSNLIRNNCLKNVNIVFGLIGSRTGVFSDEEKLKLINVGHLKPPKLTINGLCDEYKIEIIDFLKVDIEGSEFDLFISGTDWLNNVIRVVIEIHQEFGALDKIVSTLHKYGFRCLLRGKDGDFVQVLRDSIGYLYAWRPSVTEKPKYVTG